MNDYIEYESFAGRALKTRYLMHPVPHVEIRDAATDRLLQAPLMSSASADAFFAECRRHPIAANLVSSFEADPK